MTLLEPEMQMTALQSGIVPEHIPWVTSASKLWWLSYTGSARRVWDLEERQIRELS